MAWAGCRWAPEATYAAFDLARAVCRAAAAEARRSTNGSESGAKLARSIAAARTVSSVEKLARADRAHAATADQWDAEPDLLNTPEEDAS